MIGIPRFAQRQPLAALLLGCMLVLAFACSGGQVVEQPPLPVEEVPEPDPALQANSPFQQLLVNFEAAYKELVCRANRDYDPMSNIGMLTEPYAELIRLAADKGKTLEVYETILARHGYESAQQFFETRERIDAAKPTWFPGLTERLFDIIEACGAP